MQWRGIPIWWYWNSVRLSWRSWWFWFWLNLYACTLVSVGYITFWNFFKCCFLKNFWQFTCTCRFYRKFVLIKYVLIKSNISASDNFIGLVIPKPVAIHVRSITNKITLLCLRIQFISTIRVCQYIWNTTKNSQMWKFYLLSKPHFFGQLIIQRN